jgi:hypothetical protein
MENILRYRAVMVLGVLGFGVAMLVVVAGGFQSVAYLYASQRGAYQSSLRHRAMMILGVIGFAVAMTARDELSSIYTRTLLGGIAGGFIGIGVFHAYRRPDRQ